MLIDYFLIRIKDLYRFIGTQGPDINPSKSVGVGHMLTYSLPTPRPCNTESMICTIIIFSGNGHTDVFQTHT